MNRTDRYILSCPTWDEFYRQTGALSKANKGRIFERLVQLYLQTAPEYRTALEKVWLLREAPASVLAEIGLPRDDLGIDIVARPHDGSYWAVQKKFRTDEENALGWGDLSTFFALSAPPRQNISLTVVAHTIARPVGRRELARRMVEIGPDDFRNADWSLIRRT